MDRQSWTRQKVLDEIQALYRREGRINSSFVQVKNGRLYAAGAKYFGSWKRATRAAGFKWGEVKEGRDRRIIWTPEKVVAKILEIYNTDGRANANHLELHYAVVYQAGRKNFGSWQAAIEAAGLDYEQVRREGPRRSWNKKRIAAEIRRRSACDQPIHSTAVQVQDAGLYKAAKIRFGKNFWAKALRSAGFDHREVGPRPRWFRSRILREIRKLASLGIPLNDRSIRANRYGLFLAACRRFKGWGKAVTAAGFDYEKIRLIKRSHWTKRKIIREIRRLEETGARLSFKAMSRDNRCALVAIAAYWFGSWGQAVEAAGINYQWHCCTWSAKTWLRKLDRGKTGTLVKRASHRARQMRERRKK